MNVSCRWLMGFFLVGICVIKVMRPVIWRVGTKRDFGGNGELQFVLMIFFLILKPPLLCNGSRKSSGEITISYAI